MAYAALRSLAQILHQTLNRDYQYLILDEKQQIESLVEIITAIQKDFSSQKITQDEESEIRDSAYIVEDIIESRIIERFRTESAGNEDGSTEKKLVRFNVLEDWIVASSKSAPSKCLRGLKTGLEIWGVGGVESAGNEDGSMEKKLVRMNVLLDWFQRISRRRRPEIGLEIVGVGGVEKPITFQDIDGIRQLARTFRFKAWFLHSDVLLHDASPYETLFFHSDVLHDDASPYSYAIWTLKRLANHGTEIVIIDTYSMGTSQTMEELRSFGFDTSLFVGAITSENFRALVANRADDAWFEEPGPSNIDITSGVELKVTKKSFFTGLKHRIFFPQISQLKKKITLKIKWAWWKKPSPAPSPRPCATCFDRDATEEYKSPMAMAGVDAANRRIVVMRDDWIYGSRRAMADVDADRCIVVTRDLRDIKAANAAGISSLWTDYGYHEFKDCDLDTGHDAHPTYVLPTFTW